MSILRRLASRSGRALLAAGLSGAVLCAGVSSAASTPPDENPPVHSGLSDHLTLPSHTLATGSSEMGFLVVDNRTKDTINLSTTCRPELEGLLRGSHVAQQNWSSLVCSKKALFIRPGLTRLPIRFVATYLTCSQDPNGPSEVVRCVDGNREPSLPIGDYVAHVDGGGAPLPVPRAIRIHVTAQ